MGAIDLSRALSDIDRKMELNLNSNGITDRGAESFLHSLYSNHSLGVDLYGNGITPDLMKALIRANTFHS